MKLLAALVIVVVLLKSINADPEPEALLSGVTSLAKASGKTNLLSTHAGEQAVGLASATATSGSNLSTGENGELKATSFTESAANTNALLAGGAGGFGNLLDVGHITNNSALASSVGGIASATATANTLIHASSDLANVENLANSSGFADTLINSTGGITNIDSIAGATAIATSILHSDAATRSNFLSSVDSSSSSISDSLQSIHTSLSDIDGFFQSVETSTKNISENATTVSNIFNSNPVIVYNDIVDFEDFESSLGTLYENSLEYLSNIDYSNEIILTLKSVHVALLDFVFSVSNVTVTDLQRSSESLIIHETWNTGIERITVSIDIFVVTLNDYLVSYDDLDDHTAITIHNVYLLTLSASLDVISEFGDFLEVAISVSNSESASLNDAVDLYLQDIVQHINYLNRNESKFLNDSPSFTDLFNAFQIGNDQFIDEIASAKSIVNTYSETLEVFTSSLSQFSETFDSINSVVSTFSGTVPVPDTFNSIVSSYSELSTNLSTVASQVSEISAVFQDNTLIIQKIETHTETITSTFVSIYESYDITNYVTAIDNLDTFSEFGESIANNAEGLTGLAAQGQTVATQIAKNFQSLTNTVTTITKTTTKINSVISDGNSIDALANLPSIFKDVSDISAIASNTASLAQNLNLDSSQFVDLLNNSAGNLASTESSLAFVTDNLEKANISLSIEEITANISNATSTLNVIAENQIASNLSNQITFISLDSTTSSFASELEVLLQEYI